MNVTTTIEGTRLAIAAARRTGQTVGLVPTMGALHEGHASLIRAARDKGSLVVVSIFVNPTQFGPNEDFSRYPRPLEKDLDLCRSLGVDLVFAPSVQEMYPPGSHTTVQVAELQDVLCGASRPGHFKGVATVVLKLFNIVQPDVAYFGQKDAQQVRIIQQMVADLNVPVRITVCPTVREADGLALSSRNQYLDPEQRRNAPAIFQALDRARRDIEAGERDVVKITNAMRQRIEAVPGSRIDYIAAVSHETLQPITPLAGRVLLAVAIYFGTTRLIDNLLLDIPAPRSNHEST